MKVGDRVKVVNPQDATSAHVYGKEGVIIQDGMVSVYGRKMLGVEIDGKYYRFFYTELEYANKEME